jgi:hypothetical protein
MPPHGIKNKNPIWGLVKKTPFFKFSSLTTVTVEEEKKEEDEKEIFF